MEWAFLNIVATLRLRQLDGGVVDCAGLRRRLSRPDVRASAGLRINLAPAAAGYTQ